MTDSLCLAGRVNKLGNHCSRVGFVSLSRMEHNGDASGVCVEDRMHKSVYSRYVDMSCCWISESDNSKLRDEGGKGRKSNSSDGLGAGIFVREF